MDLLCNRFRWAGIVLAATLLTACEDNKDGSSLPGGSTDTTPPTVSSTSPADSATGVAINAAITATFSEAMTASTLTTAFTIAGVPGAVTYSGTTATFTPTSSLASNTPYTATITTGVKDAAGNALANNHTWSFTTQPASAGNAGALDMTFNSTGKVVTSFGAGADFAKAIAIQADGKIVVAGVVNISAGFSPVNRFAIARYNMDGSLDTTFGTSGKVTTAIGTNDSANAVAIQADGKIVAAGSSNNWLALVRYNTDGGLDTTFDTDGKVTADFGGANAVAIQADGKIVAAGTSNFSFALVRYNTDGSLDTTFDTDGKVTADFGSANAVAIQADGKIVVAARSLIDFTLARYNTNGSLDTTFDTDGKVTTDFLGGFDDASAVAIQSDGKIVAAGWAIISGFALARYNTDGSLDTTFDTDGKVTTTINNMSNVASAVAIQSDGKIVAAGYLNLVTDDTDYDFAVVRYLP